MGRELISRRKAWISKVRIGKPFSKFKKVCSLHFKQDDYINKGENTRRGRVLKKTAVPSQNLPASVVTLNTKSDSKRAERLSKRTSEECCQVGTSKERSQSDNDIQEAKKSVCEEETSSIKMVMCFVPDCKHYSNQKTCNYFTFPADVKERKKWINLIRRKDREPTKYSLVCSCHFKDQNRKNRPTIFEFNKEKRLDFEYTGKRKRKPSQKYIADYGEVALVAGSSKELASYNALKRVLKSF
ncbi:hypothetical protein JTB14_011836 [Gonioctena quinquepunctata]|nr:hypothetical protein JTB14_011836 [Gonioctena quinquepunctata]